MIQRTSGQRAVARPRNLLCLSLLLAAALSSSATARDRPTIPASPSPSIVRATPALWIVRDADTTIYLFGTFHSLDSRTVWMENEVQRAFRRSDELVLETIAPTSAPELKRSAVEAGASRSKFLAETRTAMDSARSNGMSVDNGADTVLRRLAEQQGKKLSGLEDFADQLKALSSLPSGPVAAASQPATAPVTVNSLFNSWRTGDGDAFGMVLAALESRSPQLYQALIAQRNSRWAEWIAKRLAKPGTVFVAVGSGHLTGKDSVQRLLAAQGIPSARIA
jgi:uncharacterized protein YbaP (TraB family)